MRENELSEQELRLFEELHKDSLNSCKTLNKRRFRAIWDSIINNYPESAHFIYELLQNANDALATEASFILYEDHLIFKHNGSKHFNITESYENDLDKKVGDINSIVSIGDSPKDGSNTIGKFGIGFKSVFQYTDAPEIYDDKFKFRIENLIVPSLLNEDHPLRKQGETLFLLNFKNPESDYRYILDRLYNLDSPILFLPHLRSVTWINNVENKDVTQSYRKTIELLREDEATKFELVTEFNGESFKKILLFTKAIDIPDQTKRQNICVGYYLSSDGEIIDIYEKPNIFCFFKTDDSYRRCFICHAPFELVKSRSQRKSDSKVNKFLTEQIAHLAANALIWIRDYGIDTRKLFIKFLLKIVPFDLYENKRQISYPWEHKPIFEDTEDGMLYNAFTTILKTTRIIPTRNGCYIYARDAVICPEKMKDVLNKEQVRNLLNNEESDFIDIDYSNRTLKDYLINELKVRDFDQNILAESITPEFMSTQTKEWVLKLYKYLIETGRKLYNKDSNAKEPERLFGYAPIVKDNVGNWIVPYNRKTYEPNVFFPILKDSSLIGYDYKFIDDFYASDETAKKFFEEMGLHEPDIIDFLKNDVLPKYHNEHISIPKDKLLNEFDKLYDIFEAYKGKDEEANIIKLLFNEYYLLCKDNTPDGTHFYKIEDIYDDSQELRDFYEGKANFQFFDYEFYEQSPKHRNENEIRKWINRLGINSRLKIVKTDQSFDFELSDYQISVIRDGSSEQIYKPIKIIDYNILYIENTEWTQEKSLFMWKCLRQEDLKSLSFLTISYKRKYEKEFTPLHEYKVESTLIHNLKDVRWIFCDDGSFCTPPEILLEDFHKLGYQENNELEKLLEFGVNAIQKKAETQAELNQILNDFGGDINALKELVKHYCYSSTASTSNNDYETFRDYDYDIFEEKSNVRKTIHYIGVKLYEHFLRDCLHVTFHKGEDSESFDFNINGKIVVISTVATQSNDAIYLTSNQYKYMAENHLSNYCVVRLSLKDLGIKFDEIRDLFGRDADIDQNEYLRNKCDKLVTNYWNSANAETFKKLCQEYLISIHKEEY